MVWLSDRAAEWWLHVYTTHNPTSYSVVEKLRFHRIPTKQKRRSPGPGANKPLNPQRPAKNMGPGWRQRPRTFAPQASVMATGVWEDVGHEYTCFMGGGAGRA